MIPLNIRSFHKDRLIPLNESKPYLVQLSNLDPFGNQVGIIYGFNTYWNTFNFGNVFSTSVLPPFTKTPIVVISSGNPNVPYARILAQSQSKPFTIGAIIMYSDTPAQLEQTILINYVDANGRSCTDPIPPIYIDPYQAQLNIESFKYPIKVDGNTSLMVNILPYATVLFLFFPVEISDMSNFFYNKKVLQKYSLPDAASIKSIKNIPTDMFLPEIMK